MKGLDPTSIWKETTTRRSKGQVHGAGAPRQPRRSGNPFLEDSDDEGGHSRSAPTAPALAFTAPPPAFPHLPTPALQSSQEAESSSPFSMSNKSAIDNQAPAQQPLGATAGITPGSSPVVHTNAVSSLELPASALSTDRRLHSLHAEQVQHAMQQTSSNLAQMPGNSSGFPPVEHPAGSNPQEGPRDSDTPAVPSNSREAAAAAVAQTGQEGSVGIGSRQASAPSAAEGVPTVRHSERQVPAATRGHITAAAWQAQQAQGTTLQGTQLPQPAQQSSPTVLQPGQGPDLRHQGSSAALGPKLGVGVPAPQLQAAARTTQAGMLNSGEGAVDRGRAGPAVAPQQQQVPRAAVLTATMPASGRESMGMSTPRQGGQQATAQGPLQASGLEGMLGRAAPDSDTEEEESAASAQDRQRFMQSLQSPDQGSSRSRNLAKGFGRMKAKAKDMLQAKNAGSPHAPGNRSAQQASAQGVPGEGSHTPTDAELGKRGRLARDVNMLFAGLKKPSSQQ